MSYRYLNAVWGADVRPAATKLALLALADWANDDGIAFPSMAKLAARVSVTPRQAQRAMATLTKLGFVAVVANHKGGPKWRTKRFKLSLPAIVLAASRGDAEVTPQGQPQAELERHARRLTGDTEVTPTGDTGVTQSTKVSIIHPKTRAGSDASTVSARGATSPNTAIEDGKAKAVTTTEVLLVNATHQSMSADATRARADAETARARAVVKDPRCQEAAQRMRALVGLESKTRASA